MKNETCGSVSQLNCLLIEVCTQNTAVAEVKRNKSMHNPLLTQDSDSDLILSITGSKPTTEQDVKHAGDFVQMLQCTSPVIQAERQR